MDDVCFSYEKEMVLKHISLAVEKQRICFVMGVNGSGKTTLLKCLMGFLLPQAGKISIDGSNVADADKHAMSKLVSYVPQAIHLNTDFSVIDYLTLGRTPHLGFSGRMEKDDYDLIDHYSLWLGINQYYNIPFNKLSGGQKQMIAIARSLIQDTPLLVLDEPMSALDIGKQVDLLKVLNQLASEGKTIVLTTHNPNHALAIESESCFLKSGEVLAAGKSCDVIKEDLIQEVYGENITIHEDDKAKTVVFNMARM